MSEQDCIFSKIVAGQIPAEKVYEDDVVLAFLDINPISDGHTLVIPKKKYGRLEDCPDELVGQVCSRLGKIARAVVSAMDAEGYNVFCNNGRAAGQLIDYVHFHIIPRRSGDGVLAKWPQHPYPEGKIGIIAEKVRRNIK
jgi:histidine triad (HIT) family protein